MAIPGIRHAPSANSDMSTFVFDEIGNIKNDGFGEYLDYLRSLFNNGRKYGQTFWIINQDPRETGIFIGDPIKRRRHLKALKRSRRNTMNALGIDERERQRRAAEKLAFKQRRRVEKEGKRAEVSVIENGERFVVTMTYLDGGDC